MARPPPADTDKPHRCPQCWRIPDHFWGEGGPMRFWRTYTCQNGHRFAQWRRPVHFLAWPARRRFRGLRWRIEQHRGERRDG